MSIDPDVTTDLSLEARDAEDVVGGATHRKTSAKHAAHHTAQPAVKNEIVTMPALGPLGNDGTLDDTPDNPNADPLC